MEKKNMYPQIQVCLTLQFVVPFFYNSSAAKLEMEKMFYNFVIYKLVNHQFQKMCILAHRWR
jgi:hypothetical protein